MATTKQTAAEIRDILKAYGVPCKVRMVNFGKSAGVGVAIDTPTFERKFSDEEQEMIRTALESRSMTGIRGLPLNVTQVGGVFFN